MKQDTSIGTPASRKATTFLIITFMDDYHANVVERALRERGNRVVKWFTDAYPAHASVSISYDRQRTAAAFRTEKETFLADEVDVVWNRRRVPAVVPDHIAPCDREFVRRELETAASAHYQNFSHAFWANDYVSTSCSELKPVQLEAASEVGLVIPDTLVSNDPERIRAFLSGSATCIYKPLTGFMWDDGEISRSTYTSIVRVDDLPGEEILRATPGIFQELVEKRFEVRAQFFGNYCGAIKIDSLQLEHGELDWRINQSSINRCEQIELPEHVHSKCRALMRKLGIISGAFDFIVDKAGDWIFMEVNQAGQFLFIEDWCPELHVLDAFCQFLESKDGNFHYTPSDDPIVLSEIEKSMNLS